MNMNPDSKASLRNPGRPGSRAERFLSVRQTTSALAAPPFGRGLRDPVDAGREPGEVAPGAHDVVFRDLRAGAPSTRLPASRAVLSRALQFVLSRGRGPTPSAGARVALASGTGTSARVSRPRGRSHARSACREAGAPRVGALVELGLHHEQQHQELILTDVKAPALAQSPEARIPEAMAAHPGSCASAELDVLRGGHARNRARRPRVLLRQRDAAPPRLARRVPDRVAPGDPRRFLEFIEDGGYRRAGALALGRLGRGDGPWLAGARCIGRTATGAGSRSRFMGKCRWTRIRPSAT